MVIAVKAVRDRQEIGEQERASERAQLAGPGGYAVAGSSDIGGEQLSRVDERGHVRPELGEEVADAVQDEEPPHVVHDRRDQADDQEHQRHHEEAEHLDALPSGLVHQQDGHDIPRHREDRRDGQLDQRIVQQAGVREWS
jgi:hypothetical protein